ncbi:MAG: glycosyltransferase family 2 protein [Acidobacteriota bacterium]
MISAIVVNHNGEAHLGRCLESLSRSRAEVLVVDNASSDGSLALVQERFPEARVLSLNRNLGFAEANNIAAQEAQGEALLLLNSDAWLDLGAVELLAAKMEGESRVGLVAPSLRYPNGSRQFSWSPTRGVLGEVLQKLRNPFESRDWVHGKFARTVSRLAGRIWYTAACVLVRTDAWHSVGGFDTNFFMYFEDVDLCMRLEDKGWLLAEEPQATAFHVGSAGRASPVDEFYRPSQLHYYRIHRPVWETRLIERRLRRRFGDSLVDGWLTEGELG